MKKVFQIALGVLAAVGGFVDIGELVFNVQAGALFGYQLLWAYQPPASSATRQRARRLGAG